MNYQATIHQLDQTVNPAGGLAKLQRLAISEW
jgi:hypothetical protein